MKKSFDCAFIISEKLLNDIDSFVKTHYQYVRYSFTTSDNARYETEDIGDILNYRNPDSRKIKNICISAYRQYPSYYPQFKLSVWEQDIAYKVIDYEIQDEEEKDLLYIYTHLDDIINGARAPHSWLYNEKTPIVCFCIIWAMFSIPYLIFTNGKIDQVVNILFLQALAGIMSYIVAFLYDKIIAKYFPVTIFCIGEQVEREQKRQHRRRMFWTIVGTLVLGVIASLIAYVITKYFG